MGQKTYKLRGQRTNTILDLLAFGGIIYLDLVLEKAVCHIFWLRF